MVVDDRTFRIGLLGIVAVVITGLGLDLMEVDAAMYAAMSREMIERGDWLRFYHHGEDYLDKPPLLFWVSGLSYLLFGVSNWSFKLPSVLGALWGLYALYRFAIHHHGRDVARAAVLIFGCSAAFFLMTNDVRCDTLLTAAVISAIWLGSAWMDERRWWQLIGTGIAIGLGMLAKGPLALVAPAIALGGDVLLRRRWDVLADLRWMLLIPIIGLLLVPMLIGLHDQFGWHGVRFFFWEQSFGRITGENQWKDDSSVFFFTHELPWMMLPWTLFVIMGLVRRTREVAGALRTNTAGEVISLAGAVLVFIALSFSRFKLPHYIYVTLPLFAVLGARALVKAPRWSAWVQTGVLVLVGAVSLLVFGWSFPEDNTPLVVLLALVLAFAVASIFRGRHILWPSMMMALALGFVLNLRFYPIVLSYQSNAQAGRWVVAEGVPPEKFFGLQVAGTALDLYAGHSVRWLSNVEEARQVIAPGVVILTDEMHETLLREAGFVPSQRMEYPDMTVQLLSIGFFIPDQRPNEIRTRVLLRF